MVKRPCGPFLMIFSWFIDPVDLWNVKREEWADNARVIASPSSSLIRFHPIPIPRCFMMFLSCVPLPSCTHPVVKHGELQNLLYELIFLFQCPLRWWSSENFPAMFDYLRIIFASNSSPFQTALLCRCVQISGGAPYGSGPPPARAGKGPLRYARRFIYAFCCGNPIHLVVLCCFRCFFPRYSHNVEDLFQIM